MENYFLYVLISIVMVILPGTDTALVTKNTLSGGSGGGVATVLGIASGIFVHTAAAAMGISALIAQSVFWFEIVKYAGAIYLFYLGIQSLIMRKTKSAPDDTASSTERTVSVKKSKRSHYIQGAFSNILNPKSLVFFMTFLPQFIDPHRDTMPQMLLLSITLVILAVAWFMCLVLLINRVRAWFSSPGFQRTFQRVTGGMLILLGIKLVMEER
ncbi:LysE family translocator [Brevibacillus migulae]|uniref:LysE family translocator n=1 Tax=Brevibacillus migulae TaxID=1644114 RepID=UPI00142FAADB|nr:LysE family translocator [Brevibacillus migulae]